MSELKKRLYEMEVDPPGEVWNRLSATLDEINADGPLAQKLQEVEFEPPPGAWKKIRQALEISPAERKRGVVIPFRKIAVAAVVLGLMVSGWFLIVNRKKGGNEIATAGQQVPTGEQKSPGNETPVGGVKDIPDDNPALTPENIRRPQQPGVSQVSFTSSAKKSRRIQPKAPILLTSSGNKNILAEELKEKVFKQEIDDLSLIASNDRYIAMVNADGRMVKLPTRFSNLAFYLQDNSSEQGYLDFLFEEKYYWKEKFREWRQKLAQSSITPSVDNFFDIIGLLKSIQDN